MGAMRAVAALWLDAMLGVKFVHRVEPSTQSTHNRSAPIDNPKSPVIIPVIGGWGMMIKAACITILFLGLGGCAITLVEGQMDEEDSKCASMGFAKDSEQYEACRLQLENSRSKERTATLGEEKG